MESGDEPIRYQQKLTISSRARPIRIRKLKIQNLKVESMLQKRPKIEEITSYMVGLKECGKTERVRVKELKLTGP